MYRIRHYDSQIHPDKFIGLLGCVIRSINYVRWKLEVFIQYLVIKYLARNSLISNTEETSIMNLFKLDVEAEKLEKMQTAPNVEAHLRQAQTVRHNRYLEGNLHASLDIAVADEDQVSPYYRPKPADQLIARYMSPKRVRYARGRHRTLVADSEDFEPVEGVPNG